MEPVSLRWLFNTFFFRLQNKQEDKEIIPNLSDSLFRYTFVYRFGFTLRLFVASVFKCAVLLYSFYAVHFFFCLFHKFKFNLIDSLFGCEYFHHHQTNPGWTIRKESNSRLSTIVRCSSNPSFSFIFRRSIQHRWKYFVRLSKCILSLGFVSHKRSLFNWCFLLFLICIQSHEKNACFQTLHHCWITFHINLSRTVKKNLFVSKTIILFSWTQYETQCFKLKRKINVA